MDTPSVEHGYENGDQATSTKRRKTWPRDRWMDAIWEDETLGPNERVVAYAYARFAGDKDSAWCLSDELKRRTGIKSRDALWRALKNLTEAGWLTQIEKPRQHRSAVYRLVHPSQTSVSRTPERCQTSGRRTPEQSQTSAKRHPDVRLADAQMSGKQAPRTQIENSDKNSDPVVVALGEHLTRARARASEPDDRCSGCGMTGQTRTGRQRHYGLWCPEHPDHLPAYRRCAEAFGDWRCPRTATEGARCNQHAERR